MIYVIKARIIFPLRCRGRPTAYKAQPSFNPMASNHFPSAASKSSMQGRNLVLLGLSYSIGVSLPIPPLLELQNNPRNFQRTKTPQITPSANQDSNSSTFSFCFSESKCAQAALTMAAAQGRSWAHSDAHSCCKGVRKQETNGGKRQKCWVCHPGARKGEM